MTHDEMMSLLANTLADAAGSSGCLPILDCFSPHPGEEVTVSIPMCDDTVDIVLEDLDFPHEWEELLENSGADTMGDLVDYLCYCSQNNISLAISPEDEEKLYATLIDYTLTEITAPSGYKVAESIDFTVLPTGEIQTVVMKDAREDTPTPTPDNTPTPNHTPQPTPNTTPAPAAPTAPPTPLLTIPKTGDNSPLGLLLAIAGISLVGLAILIYKSARSKELAPRTDEDNDTEE